MVLFRLVRAGLVIANATRQQGAYQRALNKAKAAVRDGKILPSFNLAKWREDIALSLAAGGHDRNKFIMAIWFDPRTQLYIAMFCLVTNVCMYVVDPLTVATTSSFYDAFMVALAIDNLCNCQLPLSGLIGIAAGLGSVIAMFLYGFNRRVIPNILCLSQLGRNMIAATEFTFDLFQQAQNYEFPEFLDELDLGFLTLSGKVVNYSIMVFMMILDLYNLKCQASYAVLHAPWLYAQYVDGSGVIWTVHDRGIAKAMEHFTRANSSLVHFSFKNNRGACSVAIPNGIAPVEMKAETAPCYPRDMRACVRLDVYEFLWWHVIFAGLIMLFGIVVMVHLFIFMPKFKQEIERERSQEVRAKRIRHVTLCETRMAHLLQTPLQPEPEETTLEDAGIELEDFSKAPWQRDVPKGPRNAEETAGDVPKSPRGAWESPTKPAVKINSFPIAW